MKASDVYKSLRWFNSNHDHKFQNVFVWAWESDCFSVTSSAYAYEIEVKVSRSDFFADFKKPKHHFFKNIRAGFSILKGDKGWTYDGYGNDAVRIDYNQIQALQIGFTNCPNKFYFACPVGLIEAAEVPSYAGLIYIMDNGEAREIKKAPFIHKDRFVASKMLFTKYVYECLDLRVMKRDYDALKKRYNDLLNLHEDTRTSKPELKIIAI